jgi:hypothetical protein
MVPLQAGAGLSSSSKRVPRLLLTAAARAATPSAAATASVGVSTRCAVCAGGEGRCGMPLVIASEEGEKRCCGVHGTIGGSARLACGRSSTLLALPRISPCACPRHSMVRRRPCLWLLPGRRRLCTTLARGPNSQAGRRHSSVRRRHLRRRRERSTWGARASAAHVGGNHRAVAAASAAAAAASAAAAAASAAAGGNEQKGRYHLARLLEQRDERWRDPTVALLWRLARDEERRRKTLMTRAAGAADPMDVAAKSAVGLKGWAKREISKTQPGVPV